MSEIIELHAEDAARWQPQLIGLLQDAVDSEASVGFLAPLSDGEAQRYWTKVFAQVGDNGRLVLAAVHGGAIVGSVQLELASMPNALHRAEVQKLLVLRSWRRQGIGQALMTAIEQAARREGRQLLVLDTRSGDAAERLYARMGRTVTSAVPVVTSLTRLARLADVWRLFSARGRAVIVIFRSPWISPRRSCTPGSA